MKVIHLTPGEREREYSKITPRMNEIAFDAFPTDRGNLSIFRNADLGTLEGLAAVKSTLATFFKEQDLSLRKETILSTPQGLATVNSWATEIFATHQDFRESRSVLGNSEEGKGTVIRAATIHEFKDIPEDKIDAVFKSVGEKEELARGLIIYFVEVEGVTFGLEKYELEVLLDSCKIAGTYDQLCMRWRNDVPRNPDNNRAFELGLTNQYSVIVGDKQIPYAEQYPKLVGKICAHWNSLGNKLVTEYSQNPEAVNLGNYYLAYAKALGNTNLDELAENWRDVDRVWMEVKGRLQPIGSREYEYFDKKNRIRVLPDYRLPVVIEGLEKECGATGNAMLAHLEERYRDKSSWQESKKTVETIQMFPILDAMMAGSLDLQPSGQSLPDEPIVRKEIGVKYFVNPGASRQRWQDTRENAKQIFKEDAGLFDLVNHPQIGIAIALAGHELGEALFESEALREALGTQLSALLNEDRADLCITAIMPDRVRPDDLTRDHLVQYAVFTLAIYLKALTLKHSPQLEQLRSYYNLGILGLKRMFDAKFIERDESGNWRIRLEDKNIDDFYKYSLRDLDEHVEIAELNADSLAKAKAYVAQGDVIEKLPDILDLIKKVSPESLKNS